MLSLSVRIRLRPFQLGRYAPAFLRAPLLHGLEGLHRAGVLYVSVGADGHLARPLLFDGNLFQGAECPHLLVNVFDPLLGLLCGLCLELELEVVELDEEHEGLIGVKGAPLDIMQLKHFHDLLPPLRLVLLQPRVVYLEEGPRFRGV